MISVEFAHACRLIAGDEFDTIDHEHFNYLSLFVVRRLFATHGGSLRVYAKHGNDDSKPLSPHVEALVAREKDEGVDQPEHYRAFAERVAALKQDILAFFIDAKRNGKRIVGYGVLAAPLTFLEERPRYVAVGPRLVYPDGRFQSSCRRYPTLLRNFWSFSGMEARSPVRVRRLENWLAEDEHIQGAHGRTPQDPFLRMMAEGPRRRMATTKVLRGPADRALRAATYAGSTPMHGCKGLLDHGGFRPWVFVSTPMLRL